MESALLSYSPHLFLCSFILFSIADPRIFSAYNGLWGEGNDVLYIDLQYKG